MKELTIGSLKGNHRKHTVLIDQSTNPNQRLVNKPNRIVEMKQNQRYFRVEVKKGQSLLDAALEQSVSLDYKCKKGTCGKCKVELVNGSIYLQRANHIEEKKLHHLIQKGFRLACQSIGK